MSLEDEIVKSRKKQTMMEMVASDKLAAKKKILARRARAKLLKEQSRKQDRQIPNRMTKAEKKYMETYGFSPNDIPAKKSDNRKVIKDKVGIASQVSSNAFNKKKRLEQKNKQDDDIKKAVFLTASKNKNIVKSKVGELEKNKQKTDKKKSTSEPKWKQYSSISAAKKAGSLYYSKGGKKFAAVFAEDLKGVKGSSPSAKLRAYLNDKEKKRK
tara:strand:+ start:137 stop:775 length:639 start_codon:yes stop_codon:yes gene_type:complete